MSTMAGIRPEHFRWDVDGSVAVIRLDRPERKNPLTFESYAELRDTFHALRLADDVDALWERAIAAGATEVFPLELQFYGDKGGRVRDPFGHTWGLGQHVEDVSPEELERRMAAFYE